MSKRVSEYGVCIQEYNCSVLDNSWSINEIHAVEGISCVWLLNNLTCIWREMNWNNFDLDTLWSRYVITRSVGKQISEAQIMGTPQYLQITEFQYRISWVHQGGHKSRGMKPNTRHWEDKTYMEQTLLYYKPQ